MESNETFKEIHFKQRFIISLRVKFKKSYQLCECNYSFEHVLACTSHKFTPNLFSLGSL